MMQLATAEHLSTEALNEYIYDKLLLLLKTTDLKYMAIEEGKKLITEKRKDYVVFKSQKKKDYNSINTDYEYQRMINELAELVMHIYVELYEVEVGIPDFYKWHQESTKEISLYRLLNIVERNDDTKLWCRVYEDGVKRKIVPRDTLQNKYKEKRIPFDISIDPFYSDSNMTH